MKDRKQIKKTAQGSRSEKLGRYVVVSAVVHVVLLVLIVAIPEITPARRLAPKAVHVSLVSEQDLPGASKPKHRVKKTRRPPRKKVYQKKDTGKKKKARKKKPRTSDEVKNAISMLKKEIEDTDSRELDDALSRLKKEVAEQGPKETIDRLKNEVAGSEKRIGNSIYGRHSIEIMRIYDAEIEARIETNWAFAGEASNLKAWLAVKINKKGEIKDIWFDEKSGNSHLDDSAYNALMKSNPLPPLPEAYPKPEYIKGFKFGTEGLSSE